MGIDRQFSQKSIASKIEIVQGLAKTTPCQAYDSALETLLCGTMELEGLMPWSSNYTFLTKLTDPKSDDTLLAIYKPGDGERPLWDFPDQTLSLREFASYLMSRILGWPNIPLTVLRDGPHGLGSVQRFIEAEYEAHYFNMRDTPAYMDDFRQMALFDYIINNADRKGGHCLKGKDGQIWAIDHGLTFHSEPKLRTVIWEFSEEQIPEPLLASLIYLQDLMQQPELCLVLDDLISPREMEAFKKRLKRIISSRRLPSMHSGRNVPYPPI